MKTCHKNVKNNLRCSAQQYTLLIYEIFQFRVIQNKKIQAASNFYFTDYRYQILVVIKNDNKILQKLFLEVVRYCAEHFICSQIPNYIYYLI